MTLKAKKRVKGVLLLCAGTFPDIVYYGVLRLWTGDATNWVYSSVEYIWQNLSVPHPISATLSLPRFTPHSLRELR